MPLPDGSRMTVAAVVEPIERARLEAAGAGCFAVLHQLTVPDAVRTVRETPVDAVLLSVHRCDGAQVDAIDHLVRSFPDIPTVALLSRTDPAAPERLLRLGATGVRHVVDVRGPAGWTQLRQLLLEPASKPAARILGRLLQTLVELPPDTRLFLEFLVRAAPATPSVRQLARRLKVRPSTLVSRFVRAGLPSPKSYLSGIRLLYAAQYFEQEGLSVSDVAYRLECSSPQSFGRHLRATLGVTAGEFRRRFTFPVALDRFLATLARPYAGVWRGFHPLEAPELRRRGGQPSRGTVMGRRSR
jgi:AraC-like DNA-binding protein